MRCFCTLTPMTWEYGTGTILQQKSPAEAGPSECGLVDGQSVFLIVPLLPAVDEVHLLALEVYGDDAAVGCDDLDLEHAVAVIVSNPHAVAGKCFLGGEVFDDDCSGHFGFPFVGVADTYSVQH